MSIRQAETSWKPRVTKSSSSSLHYRKTNWSRKYGGVFKHVVRRARYKANLIPSDVHVIGIRSKTKLTAQILREAKNLLVIGCFCIGTNQVDTQFAAQHGIAVFNSPFSNSRSVAELVIGEVIALARQLGDRSNELHNGTWNKVSNGCWEIRGKTLG